MKKGKKYIETKLAAVIDGCRTNNRASQKILYDRYFDRLYIHCQSYRLNDQDAIALINATMLKVFQSIDSYQGEGAFNSWIHTIHKNNILNHFRSYRRQRDLMLSNTDPVFDISQLNGGIRNEVDLEYIYLAMESLPPQTKEVLELYAIQGYKHKEIARILDMSESNSKYHLGKARELMAEKLKRNHD